jgi:hypothetical protein
MKGHDGLHTALLHSEWALRGELSAAEVAARGIPPGSLANKDGVEVGPELVMRHDGRFLLWRRRAQR